jgi:rSAM/selenodomain-associated transferase 1
LIGQILVLAKVPIPGRVKTRLCPPCTPAQAAAIAQAALDDTLDAVRTAQVARRIIAFDQESTVDDSEVIQQRGDGLAERIAHAFADTAERSNEPIVQIGMDTPQVTASLLEDAVRLLTTTDAVLGPAEDGGWWALGLRDATHADLLAPVPMSTSDTGQLTLEALAQAGLTVTQLPTLRDVDTMDDARAVAEMMRDSRFAGAVGEVR